MHCQKCGEKLGEDVKFCAKCGYEVGAPVLPVYEVASQGKRLLNLIIDNIGGYVFIGLLILVLSLLNIDWKQHLFLIGCVYTIGYFLIFEGIWQRTPGKWITGTKVVMLDGSKPPFTRILGRTLCRLIPFDALSYLFGTRPVGWHDRLSHTLVVPKAYTLEQVRKIDLSKRKSGSMILIGLAIGMGVFALLGIVATITLTSLGAARNIANDTRIQQYVASMHAEAELYYSDYGDYAGVCVNDVGLADVLKQIKSSGLAEKYSCNDTAEAWAASVPLHEKGERGESYHVCADSTGFTKIVSNDLVTSQTYCLEK